MSDNSATTTEARLAARLAARAKKAAPEDPAATQKAGEATPGAGEVTPLSSAQARLWFAGEYDPDSPAYNVPLLLRLSGRLDRQALLASVRELANRHEVLRSVVEVRNAEPVAVIRPADEVPIEIEDLTAAAAPESELRARVAEHVRRPFRLSTDVPFRAVLLELARQEHALLLVVHHIATDAWSNQLLVDDLAACYAAQTGVRAPLPVPPQYASVVGGTRPAEDEAGIAWWQEYLRGAPTVLELPADRPHSRTAGTQGGSCPLVLSGALTARVREVAAQRKCSPSMLLLAAYQALLARITGGTDIAVGVPEAGRHDPSAERVVGCFVNTMVVRTDLSGDPTGHELLGRVRDAVLDTMAHAGVPFEQIVARLAPVADRGAAPLFNVLFNLYAPADGVNFPGLSARIAEVATASAKFDLSLHLFDGAEIRGVLEYRADLFDAVTVEQFGEWYLRQLDGMLANLDRPAGAAPLAELCAEHGPVRDYPLHMPLHELIERWARSRPNAIAVVGSTERISYAELDRRANRVARRLGEGVAGQRVAVLADRGIDLVTALVGVLKAGAAFVPMEPAYPVDRLADTIAAAAPAALLAQRDQAERLAGRTGSAEVIVLDDAAEFTSQPATRPDVRVDPHDLAYVIFTSGSTGQPKGVAIEHRSIVHYVHALLEHLGTPAESYALLSTAAADLGFAQLFGGLASGATLHMVDREVATDPEALARYFSDHPIDVVKMVPSHLELLAAHADLAAVTPGRVLILAGEACSWDLVRRVRQARPDLAVHNNYGPTETTVSVLGCAVAELPEGAGGEIVPLGRPFPNASCWVVDTAGRPLPRGVPGELLIASAGVARGYLGLPQETDKRFVPDPEDGTRRCYRSGDRVRLRHDGVIEFLGRVDDQVKIRGYRVELGEVAAACRALPEVRDAVVLPVGEGRTRRLAAWLVPEGPELNVARVREALAARLPEHMLPTLLTRVDRIPLTPNGKVDRQALPTPEQAPVVVSSLPATPAEQRVARVFGDILGHAEVGAEGDFFALGGDSFGAVRAVRLIDPDLRVIDLFTHPTVRELAALLEPGSAPDRGMVNRLSGPAGVRPSATVVCFPYGGGLAAAYGPLAGALPGDVELLAVELPGHDPARPEEELISLEETVERVAAELSIRECGPILVYGHCLGTVAAAALALRLEHDGHAVDGVVLGASFPNARLPGRISTFVNRLLPSDRLTSDRAYRDTLAALGAAGEELSDKTLMRSIRHDARESEAWATARLDADPTDRLRAPVLCIVGERDRSTELYEERYLEWRAVAERVELATIPNAGHYFLKHQAETLAELITGHLARWRSGQLPESAPATPAGESRRGLRTFYRVAAGQTISLVGQSLSTFALGVWVYQQTGRLGAYALITMLAMIPAVFAAPLGGAVADRHNRRKVMLACDAVSALALIGLITFMLAGRLGVGEVAVYVTVVSFITAFRRPAYLAAISQLVPKPYLPQANGVAQLGTGVGLLLAPVLGGALITLAGLGAVVAVDLTALLAGVLTLWFVRFPDRMFRRRRESFRSALLGGWRFIARRRPLVVMVLFFVGVNLLTTVTMALTAPLVLSFGTPAMLGVVTAAGGVGAVLGGLLMIVWGGTRRRAVGMVGFTLGLGLATVLIGLRPEPVPVAAGLFLWSGSNAVLNAHWLAIIQIKVGFELQGRVLAANQMLATAMTPVGFLLAPILAEQVFGPSLRPGGSLSESLGSLLGVGESRGMGLLLVVSGLVLTLWGALGLWYRPLRLLEDRLPDTPTGPTISDDLDEVQAEADRSLRLDVKGS